MFCEISRTDLHRSPKITILVGNAREWLPDIVTAAKQLIIGDGSDPTTQMGPVVTPQSRNRIMQQIVDAIRGGATISLDGRHFSHETHPHGNWLAPTVSLSLLYLLALFKLRRFCPESNHECLAFRKRFSVPLCFAWKQTP